MSSSGTKMRLRYKRPDDTEWNVFENATTMDINHTTAMRKLIHKDNVGDHDESRPDGLGSTSSCSFYHEPTSTYDDLFEAWKTTGGELITLQWTDSISASKVYQQNAYITNLKKTATVRETVTGQVSFEHTGDITVSDVA